MLNITPRGNVHVQLTFIHHETTTGKTSSTPVRGRCNNATQTRAEIQTDGTPEKKDHDTFQPQSAGEALRDLRGRHQLGASALVTVHGRFGSNTCLSNLNTKHQSCVLVGHSGQMAPSLHNSRDAKLAPLCRHT